MIRRPILTRLIKFQPDAKLCKIILCAVFRRTAYIGIQYSFLFIMFTNADDSRLIAVMQSQQRNIKNWTQTAPAAEPLRLLAERVLRFLQQRCPKCRQINVQALCVSLF